MCFALIRIEYVRDETIKPIDLLACTHQPKPCLVVLGFGDYCTVTTTTTPCWNDTRANIFHQSPCEMNSGDPVCCPRAVPPLSSFVMFYLLPAICWEITNQYTQQAGQFVRLMSVLGNIWPYRSSLTLEAAWSSSAVIQKGLSVIGFCRSRPRSGSLLLELTAANNISVQIIYDQHRWCYKNECSPYWFHKYHIECGAVSKPGEKTRLI